MRSLAVTEIARADDEGYRSTATPESAWDRTPSGALRFPVATRQSLPGFRRFDSLTKVLLTLGDQLDLDQHLDAAARRNTALVFGSATGCLDADRRFARSFADPKGIEPALFPFTLPSTCLGSLAIRHRLEGPTLSVSLNDSDPTPALDLAAGLFVDGVAAALLGFGDWGEDLGVVNRLALVLLKPAAASTAAGKTFDTLRADPWAAVAAAVDGA